ncbi:amidase [Nocardioides ginsengisegetis]|uniref:Amidase n=1 Tax=Nocardioides ginsengisegetis TaxID=661491 RepID=A0A7W3PAT4_9ACTN|nr:amidase [Nocardioides ginsengisegetis]MBA8804836.1 amidase [Nocardioides ginsengisegetis]
MTIDRPHSGSFASISETYGLRLSTEDLNEYVAAADAMLASWDLVEALHDDEAPPVPERSWSRPSDEDNVLGAWYVTTHLQETTEGPLAGVRVAIKDNTCVAGVPMMNGSHMLQGFMPSRDATVVTRLLAAGAVIAGKAVCEDLCMSAGSHTSKTGPVLNPWDLERSAGGSSSGSGVLVATGQVDMAISGDQGGSIRVPAAWLGLVGHKPTWGLVPYTGAIPVEQSLDHLGPTGRSVNDVARMLTVIAGPDGLDPRQPLTMDAVDYVDELTKGAVGLRIGVVSEGFDHANSEPEVDESVRAAVSVLQASGLLAERVSIPWHLRAPALFSVIATEGGLRQLVDGNAFGSSWKGAYDPDAIAHFGTRRQQRPHQFPESVNMTILAGRHSIGLAHGRHYAMARNLERSLAAAYDSALSVYDVLVMPTTPIRAAPLPGRDASVSEVLSRGTEMLANTAPFDVTGHPACSVPAGVVDGLPVGLMVIGRKFDDATVLRVAHALEIAIGGFPPPPDTGSNA